MLGRCPDALLASSLGDHSYVAYLRVDDVDDFHVRALAEHAEVLKPPTDEPWGQREMALRTRTAIGSCSGSHSARGSEAYRSGAGSCSAIQRSSARCFASLVLLPAPYDREMTLRDSAETRSAQ
jgi:hypothetical protein